MSFATDLFISYNEDINVKQEKLSDHQSPLHSSSTFESHCSFPNPMPQTIQNLLNSDDQAFTLEPFYNINRQQIGRKNKPFIIIKSKKSPSRKSSVENFEVKIESEDKLATRTKRIIKREKAKLRLKVKQEPDAVSSETCSKMLSDSLSNFEGDGKTKKKMVQMIRNRISAQNSRDRKKAYVVQLEHNRVNLKEENTKLNEENSQLMKELKELERAQKKLQQENELLKQNRNKVGFECVQANETDFTSEDSEQDFCEESLTTLLDSLNRPELHKLAMGSKKNNKRTMGLATLISLLVVMNLVQQGNIVIKGDNGKDSDVSGIQKKILQEATEAVENLQKDQKDLSSFSGWDLIQYLEPIIKKFGSKYQKKGHEPHSYGENEGHSQPNLIKVEDYSTDNDINGNQLIKSFFQDKIPLIEEEDKKSQTSTFFCHDSFDCSANEGKDDIEEEESYHKFFGQTSSQWKDEYKIGDIEYN